MEKKEAMKILKDFHDKSALFSVRTALDTIIPELKESEGEKMFRFINNCTCFIPDEAFANNDIAKQDYLAWLEKQGGQKPANSYCQENCKGFKETGKCFADGDCKAKRGADSIDKAEPKFHVGDWVVFNNNHQSVYQVERIDNYRYYLRHYLGGTLSVHFDNELLRLWTIQDARAGDILEFGDHGRLVVGIVSHINKSTGKVDVSCLLEADNFKVGIYYALDTIKPHPATKEQRDLLFQKMKEAGYEWDDKKKKLKKIEPKFKVGDWVVSPNGVYWHIDAINNNRYEVSSTDGACADWPLNTNLYYLWTIQDAKDGDVLAFDDETIVIFKDLYNATTFHSYCHIEEGVFSVSQDDMPDWWEGKGFHPATKEQYETLMKAMTDAGYTFDSKKKELKKVIVPIFHIGDTIVEKDLDECGYGTIKDIKDGQYIFTDGSGMNINEQEGWQIVKTSTNIEQKPIWSDYDECMLTNLLDDQHCSIDSEYVHWLKSIKDKYAWKPSKEQLTQLKIAVSKGTAGYFNNDLLRELYKQLKSL